MQTVHIYTYKRISLHLLLHKQNERKYGENEYEIAIIMKLCVSENNQNKRGVVTDIYFKKRKDAL